MTASASSDTCSAPAPRFAIVATRVVDEDAAHGLRRCRHEMGAVLPVHALVVDQPQVGFVDQGRRLQAVAGALAPHVVVRQTTEFVVDDRHQEGERKLIPVAPRSKKRADVARNRFSGVSVPMHRAAGIIWPSPSLRLIAPSRLLRLSE